MVDTLLSYYCSNCIYIATVHECGMTENRWGWSTLLECRKLTTFIPIFILPEQATGTCAMLGRLLQRTMGSLHAAWRMPMTPCVRTVTSSNGSYLTERLRAVLGGSWTSSSQPALLRAATPVYVQLQTYKTPAAVHKRCPACYFVKRQGRLFVECKLKPRHKQMQRMSKKKLFRENWWGEC